MNSHAFIPAFILSIGISQTAVAASKHLPNFREVVSGSIYRGGVPNSDGIEELARMGVHTILSIRDEDPIGTKREKELARKLGMNFLSIPISSILPPSNKKMDAIENVLNDQRYYPIYVHCTHGQDRVGLVIGLYRVFYQNVPPKEAYQEMLALGFKPILIGLRHYFEKKTGYDTDHDSLSQTEMDWQASL